MNTSTLFPTDKNTNLKPIGNGYGLKKISDDKIGFYRFDKLQKVVPRKPQIEFRLFVIELAQSYALKKE